MLDISRIKDSAKAIWDNEKIQDITKVVAHILIYGALISYTAHSLFSFTWNINTLLGFGISFYLLRVEAVEAVRDMRR